jgi:hypothetical protein
VTDGVSYVEAPGLVSKQRILILTRWTGKGRQSHSSKVSRRYGLAQWRHESNFFSHAIRPRTKRARQHGHGRKTWLVRHTCKHPLR